jgi:hypothetical protein
MLSESNTPTPMSSSTPNNLPIQSLGDIMDKLTILTRKIYFGEETAIQEHEYLKNGLVELGYDGELIVAVIRLTQMNFEIWNLENEIRKGGENKFSLDEIGRRALEIRNLNRKRIQYKNEITLMDNVGFREVKTNHLSQ